MRHKPQDLLSAIVAQRARYDHETALRKSIEEINEEVRQNGRAACPECWGELVREVAASRGAGWCDDYERLIEAIDDHFAGRG